MAAVLALVACIGSALPAAAAVPGRLLAASDGTLQQQLDRAGTLLLESDTDYEGPGAPALVVHSGQQIIGGWNTHVPRIIIAGGSHDVVLMGLRGTGRDVADVVFDPGPPTTDVQIVGGNGGRAGGSQRLKVEFEPGSHVERLALSEFGGLRVRHAHDGYIRDSVFTRFLSYWRGPVLRWEGNVAQRSGGNAFLGMSLVTPQSGAAFRQVGDLWLVGWDCESWNSESHTAPACFEIDDADRIVSIGLSGGTAYPKSAGPLLRLRRVGELVTFFLRGRGGSRATADVELDGVGSWLDLQNEGTSRVRDGQLPGGAIRFAGAVASVHQITAPTVPVTFAAPPSPPTRPLSLPRLRAIPDPPDPVRPSRAVGRDDAAWIQAQLDASGVVRLESGTYLLDRPLRLGTPGILEGLIGRPDSSVVLRAAGDFPIISGRARPRRSVSGEEDVRLALVGLTFVGGSHGIRWSGAPDDLGPRATIAWSTFRDLRFLHQRVAAVEATGITGLDSNLWYRVDVRDVPIAFRGEGAGVGPGMNYADKQMFLDCQFQHVADTVWSWRADRSSGGEVWQQDYFLDVGQLSRTRAANNLLWYDSVFEDVHGAKGIEVVDRGDTATYYFYLIDSLWRGIGPQVVTDSQSAGVGTLFVNTEFAQHGGALVSGAAAVLSAWNSRITGSVSMGPVRAGAFIDSRLGPYDRRLLVLDGGVPTAREDQLAVASPATD